MSAINQNGRNSQSDIAALRELAHEVLAQVKAREPFVYRVDIATMPCKDLVQSIIQHRGAQAAAVLATKLNAELARRGKERVVLQRAARNGNGTHVDS